MSILIKGCKMPSYCDECPVEYDGMCRLLKYKDTEYHKRLDDCPLVAFDTDDVAPVVHAHWKYTYERNYTFFGTCSACEHVCQENSVCGYCGAIMDESEDNK